MTVAFALLFLIVGVLRDRWSFWPCLISGGFGVATVLHPLVRHPLNVAWMWLGLVLHRVVNPIVLTVLFACVTLVGVAVEKSSLTNSVMVTSLSARR